MSRSVIFIERSGPYDRPRNALRFSALRAPARVIDNNQESPTMRYLMRLLMTSLFISGTAFAQERMPVEQVCGPPYENVTTTEKGNLDAKAQTLFRIGSADLQGAAERTKNEVILNSNRSDAIRQLIYLNRISCVLIYQDQSLSTDEKLKRIQMLVSGLQISERSLKPTVVPQPKKDKVD